MSIVLFLGKDVNEYKEKSLEIIENAINNKILLCEYKLTPLKIHLHYTRKIKDKADKSKREEIEIYFLICTECKRRHGHALLPDFLSPYKQYSANEIESVIIDSASQPVSEIDTEASESTIRRWIKQVGRRIIKAVSVLKAIFMEMGRVIAEVRLTPGHCYSELEQMLEMALGTPKYGGNKLGLANIWLSRQNRRMYI